MQYVSSIQLRRIAEAVPFIDQEENLCRGRQCLQARSVSLSRVMVGIRYFTKYLERQGRSNS